MWLNESTVAQFGLNILNTPKKDYEGWANIVLPRFENRYNHPYCKQIESVLIRALARNLGSLSSIGKVPVARYCWQGSQLVLKEDFSPNMLDLTDEGGTNYIGGYKSPSVYTPPCIGVTQKRNGHEEFVPVFLDDKELAEGKYFDPQSSLFLRTRDLDTSDFRSPILNQLLRRLNKGLLS